MKPAYPLDIADSVAAVERRLQAFLQGETSRSTICLDRILSTFAARFERAAIIGGMVRDFARVGAPGFHSDVDLVIDAAQADVMSFAGDHGARANAFGGFRMVADGWEFDFWAMETTWAAREGHVVIRRLEDVLSSTFFDHDAIMYDLGQGRVICANDYISHQRLNNLEINLLPNPSTQGCLYRAARRIIGWELASGPRLRTFIDEHLDGAALEHMVAIERRKNAAPIIQSFSDADALRAALL